MFNTHIKYDTIVAARLYSNIQTTVQVYVHTHVEQELELELALALLMEAAVSVDINNFTPLFICWDSFYLRQKLQRLSLQ
mmetsp:Transcript_19757/g.33034  ORF Transcript_19757/g.33034 Transcript_19757/m.33034 type:complete len:80 (-) Transcript_19757:704-943(-)